MENGLDYCCGKAVTKQLAAIKQADGEITLLAYISSAQMNVSRVYVAARRSVSKGRALAFLTLVPEFICDFCRSAKLPIIISLQRMFCNRS